jgi:dihydroflavonol-4-reductase
MRVTVTGGTGRLGNVLVRKLLERGDTVRVLDMAPAEPSLSGLPVELVRGSVLDAELVQRAIDGADEVYHLAAKVSVGKDRDGSLHALNVQGTEHVLAAVAHAKARLVHCSSHSALEFAPFDQPLDEERPLALRSPTAYRRSKAEAELRVQAAVRERGVHAVIVNPSVMIGPWDFGPSLPGKALLALARGELPALIDAVTDYVDVRDVASSMLAAAQRGVPGERYLLCGEVVRISQLVDPWSELTGVAAPRLRFPFWMGWAFMPGALLWSLVRGTEPDLTPGVMDGANGNRIGGHAKASRVLGHAPRPLREALADTLAFFRERGWVASSPR